MNNTCWIVELEPIDTRYTKQWYDEIPKRLYEQAKETGTNINIVTLGTNGIAANDKTTAGAFLDFFHTNSYKASQVQRIAKMFQEGYVKTGDKFLVTDGWNFVTTAIRYMAELSDTKIEIHSIWHAGAYDPSDILGMKMENNWSSNQERAWFYASDFNYYATDFHRQMFLKNLNIPEEYHGRAIVSGQPHEASAQLLLPHFNKKRSKKIMVFPHRLNNDKQPEIFKDLMKHLPTDWEFIITQEHNYSKSEYYEMMAEASIVFSCSLHENLGISQMEGAVCGAIPIMPTRASYKEMYDEQFLYPAIWTADWQSYIWNREKLVRHLISVMDRYESIKNNKLTYQVGKLVSDFMSGTVMYQKIIN